MIGNILATITKVATIPVDVASIAIDMATGGSGSKESRTDNPLVGDLEKLRDAVTKAMDDIDKPSS